MARISFAELPVKALEDSERFFSDVFGWKAVQAAGGSITRQPFSFPGGRRFHFREPGGNELAAFEADQPAHQE